MLFNKCSPSGREDISRTFGLIEMNGAITRRSGTGSWKTMDIVSTRLIWILQRWI